MKLEEYQKINGKPYGGLWCCMYRFVYNIEKASEEDPIYATYKELIIRDAKNKFPNFEIRNMKIIYKPRTYADIGLSPILAIKFLVWGRAFKVFKLIQKKQKRKIKKGYVSGRRR